MINISVPESYAIDYLSILEVKLDKENTSTNEINYMKCLVDISNQIENLHIILKSHEYANLYEANLNIFTAIEHIHKGKRMSAKELDSLNYERFKAKQVIQKKYFDNVPGEVKIGYK